MNNPKKLKLAKKLYPWTKASERGVETLSDKKWHAEERVGISHKMKD